MNKKQKVEYSTLIFIYFLGIFLSLNSFIIFIIFINP
nr:MAG TPA: hypothetical protein [Caudoviricetes sp.]